MANIKHCPKCLSTSIVKKGKTKTKKGLYQRYYCKSCKKYFKVLLKPYTDTHKIKYIKTLTSGFIILKDKVIHIGLHPDIDTGISELDLKLFLLQLSKPNQKFYEKLNQNPYDHVKNNLLTFIEVHMLPVLDNGNILAFKYICKNDEGKFVSCFDMKTIHEIDKEVTVDKYDDNPDNVCSYGLHFAGLKYLEDGYLKGYYIMAVEVDPRDIVSLPSDYLQTGKARCKKYIPRFVVDKNDSLGIKRGLLAIFA